MAASFPLGRLMITVHAQSVLQMEDVATGLRRYTRGDWGELCPEDALENDLSLEPGFRLLSAYTDRRGNRFWIITEADRSATTILLPEDY